eukprot:3360738-Amphidinium_carterae.1
MDNEVMGSISLSLSVTSAEVPFVKRSAIMHFVSQYAASNSPRCIACGSVILEHHTPGYVAKQFYKRVSHHSQLHMPNTKTITPDLDASPYAENDASA